MKIAFQGVPGAYSELCIREYFNKSKEDAVPYPCPTFDAAFQALVDGTVERAMLPVENSLGGTIYRNIDLLLRCPVNVIGE
ncbi:hypothetical protein AAMO2058_001191800, partial [Amorphochlora amoebiformis]|eukprot:589789-Amorphochlora_amoeboformis.AAC.1